MSCNTMRDLEYEREKEEAIEKKRKDMEKRQKEKEKREKERREKAITTIKDQAKKLNWLIKEFPLHPGSFHMYKPGTSDIMKIDVFEDGVVRVDTPGVISPANHPSSDAFMNNLRDILKGKWVTVKKYLTGAAHAHAHSHGHMHTHTH